MAVQPGNWLLASTIPAAHQRSVIGPSRHRLTFLKCSRQIPIIDSTALVGVLNTVASRKDANVAL